MYCCHFPGCQKNIKVDQYCFVYCFNKTITTTFINSKDDTNYVFQFTNLEILQDGIFDNLNINDLHFLGANIVSISENVFTKVKAIKKLFLECLNAKIFFTPKIIEPIKQKLKFLQIRNNIINRTLFNIIFDLFNKTNLEMVTIENISSPSLEVNLFFYKKLQKFQLIYNNITNFDIIIDKNLKEILIERSNLFKLNIITVNNSSLYFLSLKKNFIKEIPSVYLPELKEIYLDFNDIKRLKYSTFLNFKSLKTFFLGQNKLNFIEPNTFCACEYLDTIYLPNNELEYFSLKCLKNLKTLNLNFNKIKFINLENLNLQGLYLDSNSISNINISIKKINYFSLTNNKIISIISSPISLDYLNLESALKNFSNFYSYLTKNKIKFSDMIYLNLGKNYLNQIDLFPELKSLEELDLRNNLIKSIGFFIFRNLVNLKLLYLSNNLIKYIETNSFENNRYLQELYLENNYFTEIPYFPNWQNLNLIALTNQNNQLTTMNRIEGSISRLFLDKNEIRSFDPKLFCSVKKDLVLLIKNINKMNGCTLKQLNNNVRFKLEDKLECSLKQMQKKYNKINFDENPSLTSNCSENLNNINSCDDLTYSCSSETLNKRYTRIISTIAINGLNEIECFGSFFLQVYCFFSNSSIFNIKLKFGSNNYIQLFDIPDNKLSNDIQIFDLKKLARIIYEQKSKTVVTIFRTNNSFSVIIRSDEVLLKSSKGLINYGCRNVSSCYFDDSAVFERNERNFKDNYLEKKYSNFVKNLDQVIKESGFKISEEIRLFFNQNSSNNQNVVLIIPNRSSQNILSIYSSIIIFSIILKRF